MKVLLLGLLALFLAPPALASPPPEAEACSPRLAFIHPNPPVACASLSWWTVCVDVDGAGLCVRPLGPALP